MNAPQPEDYDSRGDYQRALSEFRRYRAEPNYDDEDDNGFSDGDCDYWDSGCYGNA